MTLRLWSFLPIRRIFQNMQRRLAQLLLVNATLLCAAFTTYAQPPAAANAAFDTYTRSVEARLAHQHSSPNGFLVLTPQSQSVAASGKSTIEQLSPAAQPADAMIHHWRGTAFVPHATVADFIAFMKNVSAFPQRYAPQVTRARILSQQPNHLQTSLRVQQTHVLTIVMDIDSDTHFFSPSPHRGYSIAHSTRIAEIDATNTSHERTLSPSEGNGFLWRLNTYWTYEERDNGLYIQVESISLTRSIPTGLGWIVRPFVESVPRESLEFTLRSTANGLHK